MSRARLLLLPLTLVGAGSLFVYASGIARPAPRSTLSAPKAAGPATVSNRPAALDGGAVSSPASAVVVSGGAVPGGSGADLGHLGGGIWRQLNADTANTEHGEYSILRELEGSMVDRLKQLSASLVP